MSSSEFEKYTQFRSQGGLRRITSRIIGAAEEHGFPAVCKIRIFKREESTSGREFVITCTGTLIAPRLVLFAAHCVQRGDITKIHVVFNLGSRDTYTIRVDEKESVFRNTEYDMSAIESGTEQSEKIKMSQKDIAFIVLPDQLPQPVKLIKPMPMLPMQNLRALKAAKLVEHLTAVGYGRFSNLDEINQDKGGKKRSAQFSAWSIDKDTDMLTIFSNRVPVQETGELTNIAKGDSGGAIICTYLGVPYLVGVISFYDTVANSINIARSYAVGVDLVENMLMVSKNRNKRYTQLFNRYRQSDAPYGFNFRGQIGAAYQPVISEAVALRNNRLSEFRDASVFQPSNIQELTNVEDLKLTGEVKWFRNPKLQLALVCTPLAIFAIMGLRAGLSFDDE